MPDPLPILDDPEADLGPAEDELDDGPRTVLITGANGVIGRKLRAAWDDRYDLVLIDAEPDPADVGVEVADLGTVDEAWIELFHGVDTVVHLAGRADPHASWADLVGPELDATINVFQAAALAGVERVVFAGSHHAMGGYRELGDIAITSELPPRPGNALGAAKLMAERVGRGLAAVFDLTFVALRLGEVQGDANRAEALHDEWHKELWLSDPDLVRLFDRAVEADLGDAAFVVVNGLSGNHGTRWDLAETFEALGYTPTDDAFAADVRDPGPRSLG